MRNLILMRRALAAAVIGLTVLVAIPVRAESRHSEVAVPTGVFEPVRFQAPPRTSPPRQRKRHFIAAVVVVTTLVILGVVVGAKYGD